MVGALADLADPLASDAIMTAFREGLVDEAIIDQAEVDVYYSGFADPADAEPVSDWLSCLSRRFRGTPGRADPIAQTAPDLRTASDVSRRGSRAGARIRP